MTLKESLLDKNIEVTFPSKEALAAKLKSGRKLKVYLGIDPTSPEIHLGNAIALKKLREFQDENHSIILLIGDFTGLIGDPSDKTAMRQKMNRDDLLKNAEKYKKQASSILKFSGKNPAKLEYNSRWLSKINLEETLELAGNFTVQQLIERDMFQKRISERKPIGLHEFLYPILQGYDSVAMNIDLEVGGTDQTFNMLVGRTLMKNIRKKEKFVVTMPLLEGTDGRKMSKSYGNTIGITEKPGEMYGKIMSLKDELIVKYFNLCTDLSKDRINRISTQLQMKVVNPMEAKKDLAFEIVKQYHGPSKAKEAQEEFVKVFQKGERSSVVREVTLEKSILPVSFASLATTSGTISSISKAIRLAENKGLRIDGKLITNPREKIDKIDGDETIVDVGKRKSVKIVWK